jgi:hypothetical protein
VESRRDGDVAGPQLIHPLQFEARLPAKKFRRYVCVGRDVSRDVAGDSDSKEPATTVEVVDEDAKV